MWIWNAIVIVQGLALVVTCLYWKFEADRLKDRIVVLEQRQERVFKKLFDEGRRRLDTAYRAAIEKGATDGST